MRRTALFLLLALLTSGGTWLIVPPRPASCKPTAPIDLEAAIIGDPSAPFGLSARASSRSGVEVDLEIILPDGVTHLAGNRKLKGKRCEARLDLQARDRTRREILVCATYVEGGARMSRVVCLVLFDRPLPSRGKAATDSRGNAILEFSP